jgi:Rod binding domain-containing protein
MDGTSFLKLAQQTPSELMPVTLPRPGLDKATDKQSALMFEGMIMTQLFQAMRKTVQPSGLFGDDSQARSTYDYLLDQAVVEHAMASGKGWGLAERLEKNWEETKKNASTLS